MRATNNLKTKLWRHCIEPGKSLAHKSTAKSREWHSNAVGVNFATICRDVRTKVESTVAIDDG